VKAASPIRTDKIQESEQPSIPRAIGGDAPNAAIPTTAISTTNMPGLAGTATTGNNQRMRNLLSFLSGSLAQVTQFYYMQDPKNLDRFEDYKTFPSRIRDTHRNEFSFFFKDDWKVLPSPDSESRGALGLVRIDLRRLRHDASADERSRGYFRVCPAEAGTVSGIPESRGEQTVFEYVGKKLAESRQEFLPERL
jgi:hypothetical protein